MPRFFFHLRDQDHLQEDREGMELPDLQAALQEALRVDRELAISPAGIYGLEFEITDSTGRTLLKVPVQERRRSRSLPPLPEAQERRRHNDTSTTTHVEVTHAQEQRSFRTPRCS